MLTRRNLNLDNQPINLPSNLQLIGNVLRQLKSGKVKITIEADDDGIASIKKRYFAMVTELAAYAGYISHKEREQFKEQIKSQLGGESIADMTQAKQVGIKIEELHLLAAEFYNYKFPNDDPDICIFNNE